MSVIGLRDPPGDPVLDLGLLPFDFAEHESSTDYARARGAAKRGGALEPVTLDETMALLRGGLRLFWKLDQLAKLDGA